MIQVLVGMEGVLLPVVLGVCLVHDLVDELCVSEHVVSVLDDSILQPVEMAPDLYELHPVFLVIRMKPSFGLVLGRRQTREVLFLVHSQGLRRFLLGRVPGHALLDSLYNCNLPLQ